MSTSKHGYNFNLEIDRGYQGIIHSGTSPAGYPVIIKEASLEDGEREHGAIVQVSEANGRRPCNVVRALDGFEEDGKYYLVLEALSKSLHAALPQGSLTPFALGHIGMDTARAVAEVARAGLCHCDLKPDNFVLSSTQRRVVLIDFGSAVRVGEPTLGYTQYLAAPEVRAGKPSETSDVYSWARMLELLLTGKIGLGPDHPVTDIVGWVGTGFAELIRHCCEPTPSKRPDPDVLIGMTQEALSSVRRCSGCQCSLFVGSPRPFPCRCAVRGVRGRMGRQAVGVV